MHSVSQNFTEPTVSLSGKETGGVQHDLQQWSLTNSIHYNLQLMHMGLVNTFAMQSFLDLSEKSRLFVEKYFNLTRPLYFDFTHLVCRSAVDGEILWARTCMLVGVGVCGRECVCVRSSQYTLIVPHGAV